MNDDILLQFLDLGLLDVGSDGAKLEKLRLTAGHRCAAILGAPEETVQWTLVAADPEIPVSDRVIVETWNALKANWATVANTHRGVPVQLLRATLLDALVQASERF